MLFSKSIKLEGYMRRKYYRDLRVNGGPYYEMLYFHVSPWPELEWLDVWLIELGAVIGEKG